MAKGQSSDFDPEIVAINSVYLALKVLNKESQDRVVDYVCGKLGLKRPGSADNDTRITDATNASTILQKYDAEESNNDDEELEGISPVARKWMRRNGLTTSQLSSIFSLGVDEIDLVAKNLSGKGKKEKMRSVFLLRGVAAYLSSGVARFTHEQAKETCLHYDAHDVSNFASNLKDLSAEVSGSKDSGYQLSPRGLASATELVKALTQSQKA